MSGKVINESFSDKEYGAKPGQAGIVVKPSCPAPIPGTPTPLPTLCEMISWASPTQIVGCLSQDQITGVSALICDECEECPECPPVPSLCELVSSATAQQIVDCASEAQQGLMLDILFMPIQVLNSQDNPVGPDISAYVAFYYVNDVLIEELDETPIATVSAPTKIVINGPYDSVSQDINGVLTINTPSVSSSIIYVTDSFGGQTDIYETYDAGWHYQNGTFDYGPISGRLVSLAKSGVDKFYRLEENNAFGNLYRFTDSLGNPAPDGKLNWGGIDWPVERPGAVNYYVIDHFRNRGWCILKIGFNQSWAVAISAANSYNLGGLTGFYMPTSNDILGVINKPYIFYAPENIFKRADTLSSVAGNETGCWLSETNEAAGASTQAYYFQNHFDITRRTKTSPSFSATYICRVHFT